MGVSGFILLMKVCYRPQTKLRKGNVFTSVCQEFCPQDGRCTLHPWTETPLLGRHTLDRLTPPPPPPPSDQMATTADGTHPTGMHSNFLLNFAKLLIQIAVADPVWGEARHVPPQFPILIQFSSISRSF